DLIEVEVRDGIRLGGIEGWRLVEVQERIGVIGRLGVRRGAGGAERWHGGGKSEMAEDAGHDQGVRKEGEDAHLGAAVGAAEREDLIDAGEQSGPAGSGSALLGSRGCVIPGTAWSRGVRP